MQPSFNLDMGLVTTTQPQHDMTQSRLEPNSQSVKLKEINIVLTSLKLFPASLDLGPLALGYVQQGSSSKIEPQHDFHYVQLESLVNVNIQSNT